MKCFSIKRPAYAIPVHNYRSVNMTISLSAPYICTYMFVMEGLLLLIEFNFTFFYALDIHE